jgi:hypothetical protein
LRLWEFHLGSENLLVSNHNVLIWIIRHSDFPPEWTLLAKGFPG